MERFFSSSPSLSLLLSSLFNFYLTPNFANYFSRPLSLLLHTHFSQCQLIQQFFSKPPWYISAPSPSMFVPIWEFFLYIFDMGTWQMEGFDWINRENVSSWKALKNYLYLFILSVKCFFIYLSVQSFFFYFCALRSSQHKE